jgi:heme-degrading monooxygenase HmoA
MGLCSGRDPIFTRLFMHVIVWEFTVREEHIQDFIRAYGANGDWEKLFRLAEGYRGTRLLRSSQQPNVFLTVDRWESSGCFEKFKERFAAEYRELDTRFESYTLSERKVGVFEDEPATP